MVSPASWHEQEATLLRAGQRLGSQLCTTNVVVLDAGRADRVPDCGGIPMRPGPVIACSSTDRVAPGSGSTVLGRIYLDADTGLAVRCTRSGSGPLTLDGRALVAESVRTRRVASVRWTGIR
jgi:hypothetical protein